MTDVKAIDPIFLSILWATPEHAGVVSQLHGSLFDETWNEAFMGDVIKDPGTSVLLAGDGGPNTIVGFVLARVAADEGEILSLGVSKSCQRSGVGGRLVEAIKRIMVRAEISNLFLEVAEDNLAAVNLYRQLGFRDVGRRKDYYRRHNGETCDALVLACDPSADAS